ncbi:hypothetical protein E1161_00360 [Saccharopolyspora aridisoli]|uniref:Uncharacterized protein n=1 Tax=Saccharopolyspora aridisoli TaxID=2530385 RepID=A0A4R4V142_9PSEU|nr:hypothetical protein [Saccharopolyspora aridisoli]TDC96726.1 hypothetical protein E1161_00360 [Saccharopolyspora aridisoli]
MATISAAARLPDSDGVASFSAAYAVLAVLIAIFGYRLLTRMSKWVAEPPRSAHLDRVDPADGPVHLAAHPQVQREFGARNRSSTRNRQPPRIGPTGYTPNSPRST